MRELVRETYAEIGRPSIDPVVFFKLQLILFFEGLRSERQLMRVVADRLSLRWYLGYDLTEALPDHSSLTRIRERYGVEVFRRFFEAIVEQCVAAGWSGARSCTSTRPRSRPMRRSIRSQPRFAVEAHLARLFARRRDGGETADRPGRRRREPAHLPVVLTEEARADLAERAADRHDWIGEMGGPIAPDERLLSAHRRFPRQHDRPGCVSAAAERTGSRTSATTTTTSSTAARRGSS